MPLVLTSFLFVVVMDEITKDVRGGLLKEIFHADDLVLLGDSWEKVGENTPGEKKLLKEKVKSQCRKDKSLLYWGESNAEILATKYLCAICENSVGVNSIKCSKFMKC